jgi:hypothetical protein
MTPTDNLDRTLAAWLGPRRSAPVSAPLLHAVVRETGARQPRPTWLVVLRGAGIGPVTPVPREGIDVRHLVAASLALLALIGLALLTVGGAPAPEPWTLGTFRQTGSMATPRTSFTATLLQDGRVLVAGGVTPDPERVTDKVSSAAELYDPASGIFTPTGSLLGARAGHTATLLEDGRVLIVGGTGGRGHAREAELYDPMEGTFSSAGTLGATQQGHSATRLIDGTVLITGGTDVGASLMRFDPTTGAFADVGSLVVPHRWGHTATLLEDGRVLLAGGLTGTIPLETAELYDPELMAAVPTGSMSRARWQTSAVLLPDGDVLVIGGTVGGDRSEPAISTVERYRVAYGVFSPSAPLLEVRANATATLLPGGEILVAGGAEAGDSCCRPLRSDALVPVAELYDPVSQDVVVTDTMRQPRKDHVAVLLADGRVLIVGGVGEGSMTLDSAEVYD